MANQKNKRPRGDDTSPTRPEAQPLHKQDLTHDQEQACASVLDILSKAALEAGADSEASNTPSVPKYFAQIDEKRSNRVLVIDGGRGAGKTTAMLTVLKALCEQSTLVRNARDSHGWSEKREGLRYAIPLDVISMETLPRERPLLFQLLRGFWRVVDELNGDDAPGSRSLPPSKLPAAWVTQQSKVVQQWHELAAACALSWTDGLETRRPHVSAREYVSEFEDSERRHADTSRMYQEFVDGLCSALSPSMNNFSPLFIVPVDDADMAPERSLHLLEMLRFFWHRRVCFLVTADIGLFHATLQNAFLAEIRAPLRDHTTVDKGKESADQQRARELAHDYLRKIFPVPQRFSLSLLTADEKWKKSGMEASSGKKWRDLLPSLPDALPDSMRELVDLSKQIASKPESEVAKLLWDDAVDEDFRDQPLSALREIRNAVEIDKSTGGSLWLRRAVPIPTVVSYDRRAVAEKFIAASNHEYRVLLAPASGAKEKSSETDPFDAFEDADVGGGQTKNRTSSAGVFLWSIAERHGYSERWFREFAEQGLRLVWALYSYRSMFLRVKWPRPLFKTFRAHLTAAKHWDTQLNTAPPQNEKELLIVFLRHVLLTSDFDDFRNTKIPKIPVVTEIAALRGWFDLRKQDPKTPFGEWFRTELPLLCAPESGLSANLANELSGFLKEFGAAAFDPNAIREARGRRIRLSGVTTKLYDKKEVEAILAEIDKASADFSFVTEYSAVPKLKQNLEEERRRAFAAIMQVLKNWDVPARMDWQNPSSIELVAISWYFEGMRKWCSNARIAELEELYASLKPSRIVEGAYAGVLVRAWRQLAPAECKDWLVVRGSALGRNDFRLGEDGIGATALSLNVGTYGVVLKDLKSISCQPYEGSAKLSPPSQAILLLAITLASTVDPATQWSAQEPVTPWRGLQCGHAVGLSPPLPSYLLSPEAGGVEWRWFIDCAQEVFEQLKALERDYDHQVLLDALYAWLLKYVHARIADPKSGRFPHVAFSVQVDHSAIAVTITALTNFSQQRDVKLPDQRDFVAWCKHIPLFAAPEYMASTTLANTILDAWQKCLVTAQRPQQMHSVKLDREAFTLRQMEATHHTIPEVRSRLNRFEHEIKAHPWLKLFGPTDVSGGTVAPAEPKKANKTTRTKKPKP